METTSRGTLVRETQVFSDLQHVVYFLLCKECIPSRFRKLPASECRILPVCPPPLPAVLASIYPKWHHSATTCQYIEVTPQHLSALEHASRTGIHMFMETCVGNLSDPIPAHAWRLSCNLCHLVSQVRLMHRFYPGSPRRAAGRMTPEIAQRVLSDQRLRACMAIGWQL